MLSTHRLMLKTSLVLQSIPKFHVNVAAQASGDFTLPIRLHTPFAIRRWRIYLQLSPNLVRLASSSEVTRLISKRRPLLDSRQDLGPVYGLSPRPGTRLPLRSHAETPGEHRKPLQPARVGIRSGWFSAVTPLRVGPAQRQQRPQSVAEDQKVLVIVHPLDHPEVPGVERSRVLAIAYSKRDVVQRHGRSMQRPTSQVNARYTHCGSTRQDQNAAPYLTSNG